MAIHLTFLLCLMLRIEREIKNCQRGRKVRVAEGRETKGSNKNKGKQLNPGLQTHPLRRKTVL